MGESAHRAVEAPGIVFIGSGNVACHLARAFKDAGAKIVQVCSRTAANAESLAGSVGAIAITELSEVDTSADFCIICVGDSAVAGAAERLPHMDGIVLHTSGSVPMEVLKAASERVGVLYPLQTFSKGRALDVAKVPFFTEASEAEVLESVDSLASMVSCSVHHADSSTRPLLHVAGVLACNFPNYLLGCAADVLARGGYNLDVLRPLVQETIDKAFTSGADSAQTGPARRGDMHTIAMHASILPPMQAEIYNMLSRAIMQRHNIIVNEQNKL